MQLVLHRLQQQLDLPAAAGGSSSRGGCCHCGRAHPSKMKGLQQQQLGQLGRWQLLAGQCGG
jgi:hypothetical protein